MKKFRRITGLRRVKVIQLGATNGKEIIAVASSIFPGGIFFDSVKPKPKGKSIPTKRVEVIVYKITKNHTTQHFAERLGVGQPWQDSQIVAFCRDYPNLVSGTSFLLEVADGTLFILSMGTGGTNGNLAVVFGLYEAVKTWPTVIGRKIAVLGFLG